MRYTPPFRAPKQKHYSVALSRLMLTTALVGVISIGGTQAFAADQIRIDSEESITLENTQDINDPSFSDDAIRIDSDEDITLTNSGDLFSDAHEGIEVEANGAIVVNNSGNINAGDDGISSNSSTSDTVTNSGEIIASEAGISAGGPGSTVVTNTAAGNIHGGTEGIEVGNGAGTTVTNAGTIEADETGITAVTFGGSTSYADDDEEVVEISVPGGVVNVTNSGTIKMVQPNSFDETRYELDSHILHTPANVGILAVSMNGGAEVDTYYDENGQPVDNRFEFTAAADDAANNAVSVTNSGTIDGSGSDLSNGIFAMASDGVEITNSGTINVASSAINVLGNSPVTIVNSGTIESFGPIGPAVIRVESGDVLDGTTGETVSVTNSGTIDLDGAGEHRDATEIRSNGGDVTLTNTSTGVVNTTSNFSGGLHAASGNNNRCFYSYDTGECDVAAVLSTGGAVTITTEGTVTTEGNDAEAVDGWSNGGSVSINAGGTITTKGDNSFAINASSGTNRNTDEAAASNGGTITINSSANISTVGHSSFGIDAWSNGGMVTTTNSGTVTTSGDNSRGIGVYSGTNRTENDRVVTQGDNIAINNSGTVSTSGFGSTGIDLWTYGGDIQVDLTADSNVSTTGDDSRGLSAFTGNSRTEGGRVPLAGGDITANLAGTISTEGQFSTAVEIGTTGGDISFMSSADVSSEGIDSRGVFLITGSGRTDNSRQPVAGGTITATNLGDLSTLEDFSDGFKAFSNGGNVNLTNEGEVTTAGSNSVGINLSSGESFTGDGNESSEGGNISLTNNSGGDITTEGWGSEAVRASSSSGNVTVVNNANLSTSGEFSIGLLGESGSAIDDDSHAEFSGGDISITNSGTIATTGLGSNGLNGYSNGGDINVTNSGAVNIAGNESRGIALNSGNSWIADGFVASEGGNLTLTNNVGGNVSTTGDNSTAIQAGSSSGNITITNSASILTTGESSTGVDIGSGRNRANEDQVTFVGGDISLVNSGTIATEGLDSRGIDTWSNGGMVTVNNSGTVSTKGNDSVGMGIYSGTNRTENDRVIQTGGDLVGLNSGTVSTVGSNSFGIELWTYGGDIQTDLTASSNVSTVGDNSIGLSAYTGNTRTEGGRVPLAGGDIIANLAGTISTGGNSSDGVDFGTSGGKIAFNSNTSVTTTGEFSDAIRLNSGSAGIDNGRVAVEGGAITATNLGNLTTAGSEAFGMIASTSGDIALDNAGDITTSGEDSGGLAGWSGSNRDTDFRTLQDGGAVTIANSGSVTTSGLDSFGIEGWSYGGSVSITTTSESSVSTTGESSYGLLASSGTTRTENGRVVRDGGEVTVNNAGTVTTAGDHAAALIAGTNNASVNVTNSGTLKTTGEGAGGIFVRSGTDLSEDYPTRVVTPSEDITIVNSGTVTTTGADASGVGVYTTENLTFNNTGVVSASNGLALETLGSTDTVTNSGSLLGGASLDVGADTLTNSGTLTGNFDFGEGDDTLNLNAGSVYSDATFDGGAGTDTATLSGGGTLAGTFSNFESGTLADGSWTLSGTAGSFNTFTTASGSTLALNGGTLSAGQVNLGAESTLSGSGTISGGLTNNGSILLASSDTLQIEGDFHSNANSTLEFSLGGASGTPHSSIEVTDGQFSFDNSDILNIRVDADTNLEGESRYQIVTADGGIDDLSTTNDLEAVEISDSSAAFSFDRTIENNALYITASATITEAVTDLAPQLEDEANAVEEFVVDSGSGGELAEQLNGLDEQELVTAVQELTAPNEAAGAQSIGTTVNTANNVVNSRITSRTSGGRRGFNVGGRTSRNSFNAEAGYTEASKVVMAYGNEGIVGTRWLDDKGYTQVWAQAFWGYTDIDGADSNQYGTSVGIDFRPEDSILIGGSFAYSRSDSDATNSSLTADTYGGMLYGAKSFDGGLSLSGVVGYFHAQNDTRRLALGSIYSGEYDTNTFTLSGNIAQEIELSSWLFTPNAGVRYAHASFDSYTETGGPAPLTISRSDLNSVELSAQASFSRNFDISATQEGLFEVHLGALYEVADSNTVVSSRFSPTGSVLTSEAGVPRLKFNVGTLVDVPLTDQISAEFAYEGTFASEYADHLLRAKFKLKF